MKKLMNRVIATVITLTMAFSMMPVAAFADIASTTTSVKTAKDANGKEYYTEIVLEPYTFYDVGGGAKQKLNEATVTNLVKNQLLYNWVDIANGCFRTAGECASVDYENYGQYFNTGSPAYDCFGEVRSYLRGLEAANIYQICKRKKEMRR